MSKNELERHLLEGVEKVRQEINARLETQDRRLREIRTDLQTQAQTTKELQTTQASQAIDIQKLSEYYDSLEPLLLRLNAILQNVG